jgi:catechol 2,3-dioxygenase-like lactoylglutathione lyase family enzyme
MSSFSPQAKAIAFLVTRDRGRAKAFYSDVLGFELLSEDAFAAVFDLDGTMLRIATLKDFEPQAHTVLGWEVADIGASVDALTARGVNFTIYPGLGQDSRGIWQAPGGDAKVAWFLDPDGNNLSLTEF